MSNPTFYVALVCGGIMAFWALLFILSYLYGPFNFGGGGGGTD
jgi:hypothetical protein